MCALHKNRLHLIINKYNLPYFSETVENVFQFKCRSKYSTTLVTFHFYSPHDHFLPNRFLQKVSTGNQTELWYFGCFDWPIEYKVKPSTIAPTQSFVLGCFFLTFLPNRNNSLLNNLAKTNHGPMRPSFQPSWLDSKWCRLTLPLPYLPPEISANRYTYSYQLVPDKFFMAEHRFIDSATVTTIRVTKAEKSIITTYTLRSLEASFGMRWC